MGINIGPNKDTAPDEIIDDYLFCYRELHEHADFVTLNISSPNTPNLRKLHNTESFTKIIKAILSERETHPHRPKILVKLSPDEEASAYRDLIHTINQSEIDGVIISLSLIHI